MSTAEFGWDALVIVMCLSVTAPAGSGAARSRVRELAGQRGSGSGLRPGLARNPKSQPLSAWVTCSLYSAP